MSPMQRFETNTVSLGKLQKEVTDCIQLGEHAKVEEARKAYLESLSSGKRMSIRREDMALYQAFLNHIVLEYAKNGFHEQAISYCRNDKVPLGELFYAYALSNDQERLHQLWDTIQSEKISGLFQRECVSRAATAFAKKDNTAGINWCSQYYNCLDEIAYGYASVGNDEKVEEYRKKGASDCWINRGYEAREHDANVQELAKSRSIIANPVSMQVLGSFVATLGIVSVALAFTVLSGAPGIVFGVIGSGSLISGVGFFSTGFRSKREDIISLESSYNISSP